MMKTQRGGYRPQRSEQMQVLDDPRHDSYKARGKLADPTRCPDCGAVFRGGRWTWSAAQGSTAHERLCPACQRIRDGYPGGYVTLGGGYLAAHRDEILHIVRNCEAIEKAEHPLQRIIAVKSAEGTVVITTTDAHLARRIAERVHDACKGSLAVQYNREENLVRATWSR